MPADPNQSWALRDIGRAKSEVKLGFMYFNDDGASQNNYQESWFNNLDTQQSDAAKVYPADHWSTSFESTSTRWQPLQILGAYKLGINLTPDAPKQTLIFGYLGPESSVPDLTIPEGETTYAPLKDEYISLAGLSGGGVAPAQPSAGEDTGTGSFSFLPPIDAPQAEINVIQQELLNETPFIPSSSDALAKDASEYVKLIGEIGIRMHNIWKMSSTITPSNVKYIRGYGPYWGDSRYAGATAVQAGGLGSMSVKVNANRAAALMYRVAPMDRDIGVDSAYPWVFPYFNTTDTSKTANLNASDANTIKHSAFFAEQQNNSTGLFNNENRNSKKTKSDERANVGFVLEMSLSSETPRGSFFQGGGGSPTVTIMWGGPQEEAYSAKSTQNFLSAFSVHCAGDKIPYLVYYNGNRNVKVYLANAALNFQQGSQIRLTVEYIGLTMMVQLNDQDAKFIRAYDTEANLKRSGPSPHGVWTDNPNISMFIMNCVVDFTFMPAYYNSWDPSQKIKFDAAEDTSNTTHFTTPVSNPDDDIGINTGTLYLDINDIKFDPKNLFTGFVKTSGVANFSTYSNNRNILISLFEDVRRTFKAQTYHPIDLKRSLANIGSSISGKQWKPDSGWPQCILDNRNLQNKNIVLPIAVRYDVGVGLLGADGDLTNDMPLLNSGDPSSIINIVWQVFTTFTTPVLFGFKAEGDNSKKLQFSSEKDISKYVTEWDITWSAELDYKIMMASAKIKLVNPPGWLIDVVSKNRMLVRIQSAGYMAYSQAVEDTLRPYVFRNKNVFMGVTIGAELTFGPGGDVYFTISCNDFMQLLKDYMLDTNLRFDGVSYYTSFCMLMQASDYRNMFAVVDDLNNFIGQFKPKWIDGSISVLDHSDKITWDGYTDFGGYGEMFFGFLPMSGTSFEVKAGSNLYEGLTAILEHMLNPRALPLFYFDPTWGDNGMFFLRIRKGSSLVSEYRPKVRSEITAQDQLKISLPLLCVGNQPAYIQASNTSNLVSHLVALGANRVDGLVMKYTGTNPRWNSLKKRRNDLLDENQNITPTSLESVGPGWQRTDISTEYGHVGYKKKMLVAKASTMLPDIASLQGYTSSRLWWLMRPDVSINGMTVYGIIDVGVDGIIHVDLGGLVYSQTLLKKSVISYKAADGSLISQFNVLIFPPFTMTGA